MRASGSGVAPARMRSAAASSPRRSRRCAARTSAAAMPIAVGFENARRVESTAVLGVEQERLELEPAGVDAGAVPLRDGLGQPAEVPRAPGLEIRLTEQERAARSASPNDGVRASGMRSRFSITPAAWPVLHSHRRAPEPEPLGNERLDRRAERATAGPRAARARIGGGRDRAIAPLRVGARRRGEHHRHADDRDGDRRKEPTLTPGRPWSLAGPRAPGARRGARAPSAGRAAARSMRRKVMRSRASSSETKPESLADQPLPRSPIPRSPARAARPDRGTARGSRRPWSARRCSAESGTERLEPFVEREHDLRTPASRRSR